LPRDRLDAPPSAPRPHGHGGAHGRRGAAALAIRDAAQHLRGDPGYRPCARHALHGHERRLRGRGGRGLDDGPDRHRDIWRTGQEGGGMRIAFIGGGNMALAIIGGLISKDAATAEEIMVVEPDASARLRLLAEYGVKAVEAPVADLAHAHAV